MIIIIIIRLVDGNIIPLKGKIDYQCLCGVNATKVVFYQDEGLDPNSRMFQIKVSLKVKVARPKRFFEKHEACQCF